MKEDEVLPDVYYNSWQTWEDYSDNIVDNLPASVSMNEAPEYTGWWISSALLI